MTRKQTSIASAGLLAALLLALLPAAAEAGPWVRPPGGTYVKLGATSFTADEGFNQGVSTGLSYESQTFNIFAEVGLPYRFQLVADLPFVNGRNNSPNGVNYINRTLGDARFQLDYGIIEDLPVTLSLEAKFPFYTPVGEQDVPFPRSATSFPDAGDGNVDFTPKVQGGYSFHPIPAWVTGEFGYRARLDNFADGLFFSVNSGIFVWPEHIALGVFTSGVLNIQEDENPAELATREFVYVQGYLLFKLAPLVPELSITLSAGTLPWARNSAAGSDLGVGVAYEL